MHRDILAGVDLELTSVQARHNGALAEAREPLRQKLRDIQAAAENFDAGVDTWAKNTADAMCEIEEQQQALQRLVKDAGMRMMHRKAAMLERKQRRDEQLSNEIGAILAAADQAMQAATVQQLAKQGLETAEPEPALI